MSETNNHIELAAEIVSAYVSNNSVPASELATLLGDIHSAIVRVSTGAVVVAPEVAKPAVAPKKSITNDYIICLELSPFEKATHQPLGLIGPATIVHSPFAVLLLPLMK